MGGRATGGRLRTASGLEAIPAGSAPQR